MSHKYSKGDKVLYTMPPGTVVCYGVIDGLLYNHNNEPTYVMNDSEVPETQIIMKLPSQKQTTPNYTRELMAKLKVGDEVRYKINEVGSVIGTIEDMDYVDIAVTVKHMGQMETIDATKIIEITKSVTGHNGDKPAPRFQVGDWVKGNDLSVPRTGRVKTMNYVSEYSPGWRYQVDSDIDNYLWLEHALTPAQPPEPKFQIGQMVNTEDGAPFPATTRVYEEGIWWYSSEGMMIAIREDKLTPTQPPEPTPALTYADGQAVCRDDVVEINENSNSIVIHQGQILLIDPNALLSGQCFALHFMDESYTDIGYWYNVDDLTLIHRANESTQETR